MNKKNALPLALAGAAGAAYLAWENTAILTTPFSIHSHKIGPGFDGFRIAHLSDIHNAQFGKGHRRLLDQLEAPHPDLIAISGDMLDARRTDMDTALTLAKALVSIAPTYYVMGNHEARTACYPLFEAGLRTAGVTVLRNNSLVLEREGSCITLIGVDIPYEQDNFAQTLHNLVFQSKGFTLLLSHHPECFPTYRDAEVDLALCGHVHGGQARIPGIGGVLAPHQGFFPKYDAGLYEEAGTRMIISRGLGNSLCPVRINNRPEIVLVTLVSQ